MKTRILLVTVLALVAGFVIGIKLSEVIGIVGVLGFGRALGIKYLPIYLAIGSAIVANLVHAFARRKSKRLDE
jgi:O-antigen ligase